MTLSPNHTPRHDISIAGPEGLSMDVQNFLDEVNSGKTLDEIGVPNSGPSIVDSLSAGDAQEILKRLLNIH